MLFEFIVRLIKYWYFRYLLVTELYMVEHWERRFIHCFLFVVLTLLALFNSGVLIYAVDRIMKHRFNETYLRPHSGHPIFENTPGIVGEI